MPSEKLVIGWILARLRCIVRDVNGNGDFVSERLVSQVISKKFVKIASFSQIVQRGVLQFDD